MFIEKVKNNGSDYLRLVSSKRITNKDGKKISTKKVEYNIGPLSKFDDGKPNYLQRLKESYKNGNPIIKELIPFVEKNDRPIKSWNMTFLEHDE